MSFVEKVSLRLELVDEKNSVNSSILVAELIEVSA